MKPDWKDAPGIADAVLDKPAQIGATRFHAGVSVRLVIERAQREYEYHQNPHIPASPEAYAKLKHFMETGDTSCLDAVEPAALDLSGPPDNRRLTETCKRCGGLGHVKFGSQEGM